MYPKFHLLIGVLFCGILVLIFPQINLIGLSIIFLSSVLIDVDHMVYFVLKKKNLSLPRAYHWFVEKGDYWLSLPLGEKKIYCWPIFIFHGIEFVFFLILLSFLFPVFLFVVIGVLLHLFCDYCHLIYEDAPLTLKISPLYVWLRNKGKKELV